MKKFFTFLSLFTALNFFSQTVSTFAGSGTGGSTDGIGTTATFYYPTGVAMDADGNVYVADNGNNRIRKITPSGEVSTLAGNNNAGSTDAIGTAATFYSPWQICIDASGNVYVADTGNHKIRKITPAGAVSTIAGSGTSGSTDGNGTAASFNYPKGIAIDATGNLYVSDSDNHKIRKITPAGEVSTIAGSGTSGSIDGNGTAASFNYPHAITIDVAGNLYVADRYNHKIRKITPSGDVTTLAGSGAEGSTDGIGSAASFTLPIGITIDSNGNLYVADTYSRKIRKVTPIGEVSTIAGTGETGSTDGAVSVATFNWPSGIAVNPSGSEIFIADRNNHKIRKITSGGLHNNEMTNENLIAVYPNPSSGIFNIVAESPIQVKLYDTLGKLLLNTDSTHLDLTTNQAGIYIAKITHNDNKIQTVKIIKE